MADLTHAQAWADSDPMVQQILRNPRLSPRDKMLQTNAALASHGFTGLGIDLTSGRVVEGHDWNPRATLPAWGALIGAGALGGAFSGAAAGGSSAAGSGSTTSLGPTAATGGTTAATVPPALATTAGGTSAVLGSGALATALKLGIPGAFTALTQRRNGEQSGSGSGFSDPHTSGQLADLIRLATERSQRTVPVHEAAMRMALNMDPNLSANPRIGQANTQAMNPRPPQTLDPQVLDAIRRLSAGRG